MTQIRRSRFSLLSSRFVFTFGSEFGVHCSVFDVPVRLIQDVVPRVSGTSGTPNDEQRTRFTLLASQFSVRVHVRF
jgi:hypothetical protein